MPSIISQMRNASNQQWQQQQAFPNDATINQIKQAMRNPQAALGPQFNAVMQFMKNGGDLKAYAEQMATEKGIDLNQLINKLLA